MTPKHSRNWIFIRLALLLIAAPPLAFAQTSSLIFERASITIEAAPTKPDENGISMQRPPLKLSIELRPEDSLRLEYIHTLNSLTPDTGVMIALNAPATLPLPTMKVYAAVDVLFVAEDGRIVQISPHVVLADMTQPVQARVPIKAILFLRDGFAASRALHVHDTIRGKMFATGPVRQE